MDDRIKNDLELFRDNVVKIVPVEAIYLFGSYAYGTTNDESDLDIYVVVPDEVEDLGDLYADVRLLWRKKPVSIDLLMGHSSVFNRRKNGPTLERVIVEKGTLLYGS
ncbi:MAG: nucleotidyltransferase domain-containing protein [Lachnospiraceae bacterium]|jgi:predicted nucleotidyltransferase|nr:nucleotidyltransferase domain-containing protein [Lachnospiraceae bacterium]